MRADMSDALDRIVPEDKKGSGLYRHDAEGSDDMPVRIHSRYHTTRLWSHWQDMNTIEYLGRLTTIHRHMSSLH